MERLQTDYFEIVLSHYETVWKNTPQVYLWDKGPIEKMPINFRVLEFPPTEDRSMWTYATNGMGSITDAISIEIHIFSSKKDVGLVELLFAVSYYHKNTAKLNLNHTINFGRSWQEPSVCNHGLISLPYLDGPELENLYIKEKSKTVKFYWLIPITEAEVFYKKQHGLDALEEKFEESGLDYLNPYRNSII